MSESLLLLIHVPLNDVGGEIYLERQACNGLRRWAENFDRVTVLIPIRHQQSIAGLAPLTEIGDALDRIRFVPLPTAYRPDQFLRALPATRRLIRREIPGHDFCCFGVSGLFGDWGSVACWEAHWLGKPYAVWTDRVESEVVRRSAGHGPWRRRLMARLTHRPTAWMERAVIGRAALGLFHGSDTFETYAPFCRRPELVHNIHIRRQDHIGDEAMAGKLQRAAAGPLRIGYVGRAEPMKGPQDWMAVLEGLKVQDVPFEAAWYGDGSALPAMRERAARGGLGDSVRFPGFIEDRERMMAAFREVDILLFCHKTPESPRSLIEALVSGCALVGYDSPFVRDLTRIHGGGIFARLDDTEALAGHVAVLHRDRQRLLALMQAAREDGRPFDDESVFRHRSDLIKTHLRAARRQEKSPGVAA
jgi:glycosyltransferase involved in cell wall biosynthesis